MQQKEDATRHDIIFALLFPLSLSLSLSLNPLNANVQPAEHVFAFTMLPSNPSHSPSSSTRSHQVSPGLTGPRATTTVTLRTLYQRSLRHWRRLGEKKAFSILIGNFNDFSAESTRNDLAI
ncbi:hypothetical protein SOMG_03634 [Schizosaccharomyces osmophilus]|uniref:Uncharacterized protein n=1 Tax=Schizosaccharomyces osmophilus TaxID=2545709 RepID=A0AAF0AW46_9SCHI|nr:uncharacterized protein SOMG_03634 [Schizosaccharomyces osmophilus]WBW73113.1 hypothetical protein SOMG_03634 [Schizosaccharomyces osmophilus]